MRPIRLIATGAFIVMLGGSALAVAPALAALPLFLPEPSTAKPVAFKGSSGVSVFETAKGTKIKCSSSATTGELHKPALGEFKTEFSGCEIGAGVLCTRSGSGGGVIVMEDNLALVYDVLTPSVGVAVALMPKTFTFACASGREKFEVKGCALGLITPINTKVKTSESYSTHFEQEKGANKEVEYFNEAGTGKVECKLLTSENGGGFLQTGLELREARIFNIEREKIRVESEIKA